MSLSLPSGCEDRRGRPQRRGKSTLLKIMAGTETVSNGDALLSPGYTVGILEQSRSSTTPERAGERRAGVAETKAV